MGEYAVIVTDVKAFIDRITLAAQANNFGMESRLVEYYDPASFNGTFDEVDVIFRKRIEYKHQKEYRLGESLILTGTFIQYCSPAQETG